MPDQDKSPESFLQWLEALGPASGDEDDWRWMLPPVRAEFCPYVPGMFNTATGAAVRYRIDCESWSCERCAPQRAMETLLALWPHFSQAERVYWHRFPWSESARARIRQRARRRGAEYVLIRRHPLVKDNRAYLFASQPLTGRDEPSKALSVTPRSAMILARRALAIPGVLHVSFSRGWAFGGRRVRRRGLWRALGPMSPETWQATCEIVAEESERRWGVRIEPNREPPHGVPLDEVYQLWGQAIEQARREARQEDGEA